jgi:hypothetical protein
MTAVFLVQQNMTVAILARNMFAFACALVLPKAARPLATHPPVARRFSQRQLLIRDDSTGRGWVGEPKNACIERKYGE